MMNEIQARLDDYWAWLRDNTSIRQADDTDWVEITTPYLDHHNDHLQIYAQRQNGNYTLTDDGYTLVDLIQSGCALDSPKRQQHLRTTLSSYGVRLDGNRLEVRATKKDFAQRKHDLVQAMLAVNDMFYLARTTVLNLFIEDVTKWRDEGDVRYTGNIKLSGKSGLDHRFDIVIPKSRYQPERIVQAITRPNRAMIEPFIFAWEDTRDIRPPESRAFALLNDQDQKVSAGVFKALEAYDVAPVLWSRRDSQLEALAA